MSRQPLYICAAKGEEKLAEELALPLRDAGYAVSHAGTLLVGESMLEQARRGLRKGVPVVVCGTIKAAGTGMPRLIVDSARGLARNVFVVKMEEEADLSGFALETKIADYVQNPTQAINELKDALKVAFPPDQPQPAPAAAQSSDRGFLDQHTDVHTFDAATLREFRELLRPDAAIRFPASMTDLEFLQHASLCDEGRLTRAGVLMFGKTLAVEFPAASIQCVRYRGTDRSAPRESVVLAGTLPTQISEARTFVEQHTSHSEAPRADQATAGITYGYPMIAVREIIANAAVHRDYTQSEMACHVRVFDDRIEISSPGQWIGQELKENAVVSLGELEGHSIRRNMRLANTLAMARFVEGEGSGIPSAVSDCKSNRAKPPTVTVKQGFVTVTIWPNPEVLADSWLFGAADSWRAASDDGEPNAVRMPHFDSRMIIGSVPSATIDFIEPASYRDLASALENDHISILSGMGGVGKTQIAIRYANLAWRQGALQLLCWVNATSRESIISAYVEAADRILPYSNKDPEERAYEFLAWLAQPQSPKWLIVLDDLVNPSDIARLWPPNTSKGRSIITTRRRDASLVSHARSFLHIDVLTPQQAGTYLVHRLGGDKITLAESTDLANELGYLPLALAQAASYIKDHPGMTIALYRSMLADESTKLSELRPEVLPDDQLVSLGAVWMMSADLAADRHLGILPLRILQFISFLSPSGIPAELFRTDAASDFLTGDVSRNENAALLNRKNILEALSRLHRLSLLNYDGETIQIHVLTQRGIRDSLSLEEINAISSAAADALIELWSTEPLNASESVLRDNSNYLYAYASGGLIIESVHPLLFKIGNSLGYSGHVPQAISFFERLHDILIDRFGNNHTESLHVLRELASWQGASGAVNLALDGLSKVFQGQCQILGANNSETLQTRIRLANWRGKAGDVLGAVSEFGALFQDLQLTLGSAHPYSLEARSSLAKWRAEAGDLMGASRDFVEVLTDMLRVLGPDHPNTLQTRANLAYWRGEAGDATGAMAGYAATLDDLERVMGPDHPYSLIARNNLAHWRGAAGDARGALNATESLLHDALRVLGPDHPDTLSTRSNLASWRGEAGDATGATTELASLLQDQLRVLGPDHPDTLSTRSNLASWRGEAGDTTGATTELASLLQDQLRVLGPDHPDTLSTRSNLASWRGEAGDATGATTELASLLQDQLRVLGPDHPDTLSTRSNLAQWKDRASSDTATAEGDALQSQIADAHIHAVKQLGSDSPGVRIAGLHNLESIGNQHANLSQIVLDEICAYLRIPSISAAPATNSPHFSSQVEPMGLPLPDEYNNGAEREVRLVAQEILQRHLNPELGEDLYWPHSRLNLRGAQLEQIDFSSCRIIDADFMGAIFNGGADFGDATFSTSANFGDAIFNGGADFGDATFSTSANFGDAIFNGGADFGDATFNGAAYFEGVIFNGAVYFMAATFTGLAYFGGATFNSLASYEGATFTDGVYYRSTAFNAAVSFENATFTDGVYYRSTAFNAAVSFENATFNDDAVFSSARFHSRIIGANTSWFGLLEGQDALLIMDAELNLPQGWRLEPSPTEAGLGKLTRVPEIKSEPI